MSTTIDKAYALRYNCPVMKDNVINAQERFEARRTGPTLVDRLGSAYNSAMIRLGGFGQGIWKRPDSENYIRGRQRMFKIALAATTTLFTIHVINDNSDKMDKLSEIQNCVSEHQPAGSDLRVQDLSNSGSGEGPQYVNGYFIAEGEGMTTLSFDAAKVAGRVLRECLENQ